MSHARAHGRHVARGVARVALVLTLLACSVRASAQVRVGALPEGHALVLRPAPSLRDLADEVRAILALRIPVAVVVGADTPEGAPDLVNEGEVGIALSDARTTREVLEGVVPREVNVRVVLGAPDRVTYATELTTSLERPTSARSIALAVLALRDSALLGRDPSVPPDPDAPAYTYRVPVDGPLGPLPSLTPTIRPALVMRVLVGYSASRDSALVSFGLGVGLCLDRDCLLIEADLPLLFEDRNGPPRHRIDYRPSVLGLRVQLRPISVGDVSFGFAIGPILRIGNANVRDVTTTFTTPGMRGTLVAGWEIVPRFELLLELGVDAALELARLSMPGVVLLEDVVTPWTMLALRIRP